MKRIIRLTESDLARIVRRVIKESNDDLLQCIANAYGLGLADVIKLTPCSDCQENPSPENAEKCLKAVKKVAISKGYDIIEMAKRTLEASACLTKMGGDGGRVKVPGIGGGMY